MERIYANFGLVLWPTNMLHMGNALILLYIIKRCIYVKYLYQNLPYTLAYTNII